MYATLSGVGRMPLVAVSPYVFVTRDAAMRIAVEDPARSPPNRLNARLTVPATMFSSMAPAGEQLILMAWR